MGVKLDLPYQGKDIDWGCSRTGCWEEWLDRAHSTHGSWKVCM